MSILITIYFKSCCGPNQNPTRTLVENKKSRELLLLLLLFFLFLSVYALVFSLFSLHTMVFLWESLPHNISVPTFPLLALWQGLILSHPKLIINF